MYTSILTRIHTYIPTDIRTCIHTCVRRYIQMLCSYAPVVNLHAGFYACCMYVVCMHVAASFRVYLVHVIL